MSLDMAELTGHYPELEANAMATVVTQRLPIPTVARVQAVSEQLFPQVPIKFNPSRHLVRGPPPKHLSMKDIGFAEDVGVSPVAVSDPFQLFTVEAVEIMRKEIFQVPDKYKFSSNIAVSQLRGYAKDCAPFTWAAWNHPETLAMISKIAEVELVPALPYEIAHINFSSKSEAEARQELAKAKEQLLRDSKGEDSNGCQEAAKTPIVGWHTDSYPFVCVLMMSNVDDMIGGETAIRKVDGEVIKVRGPSQGCAVIMQGRYITHQAMRALGARERITSVTSFRPKSVFAKDDSTLRTVRGVSNLNELYYDFAEYRLQAMEERLRHERAAMAKARRTGKPFETNKHKSFLDGMIAFAEQSNQELVDKSKVQEGFVEGINLPDATIDG